MASLLGSRLLLSSVMRTREINAKVILELIHSFFELCFRLKASLFTELNLHDLIHNPTLIVSKLSSLSKRAKFLGDIDF